MLPALIPILAPILGKVVGNLFPDPEQQAKAQQELMVQLMQHQQQIETAAASIIQSEAASKHWLAANWRPITMLTFLALIVARWFGWAAPNLDAEEYIKLWSIVEFGLGGYVVGRSVEKIAPGIADALRRK
jgi:ribosomal protein L18